MATGADVQFVTIGNETTTASGVAGTGSEYYLGDLDATTADMAAILVEGAKAVRAADAAIMTGVHVAPTRYDNTNIYNNANSWASAYSGFFDYFDFFSTSCYPYWSSHGGTTNDMESIASQLAGIADEYGVATLITEYNWPYQLNGDQDCSIYQGATDNGDGTYTGSYGYWNRWTVDRQGQADMIRELNSYFATYDGLHNGNDGYFIGAYYWEPTWIAVDNTESAAWRNNQSKWYNYGCGVATYYGAQYLGWSGYSDPEKSEWNYAFGSATDEYTLIQANGKAASSLSALNYSTDIMPILVARAQVSTSPTDTVSNTYSIRFVGEIEIDSLTDYDSVGFRLEYCDGTNIKTLYDIDSTKLYTYICCEAETYSPAEGSYLYAYRVDKIPATGIYYFKVITDAKGAASYQQSVKYYKYDNGSLSVINGWDYPGTNASLSAYNSALVLYPDYMQ